MGLISNFCIALTEDGGPKSPIKNNNVLNPKEKKNKNDQKKSRQKRKEYVDYQQGLIHLIGLSLMHYYNLDLIL